MREFGKPKQLRSRSPGHHEEFIMACKGEKPREFSRSNYGYSGPMTANIQLGNLCARAGKKLESTSKAGSPMTRRSTTWPGGAAQGLGAAGNEDLTQGACWAR